MTTFNGMPVSEDRVLALGIVFSILFLAVAVACAFLLYTSLTMKNPKENERLRNLKKKTHTEQSFIQEEQGNFLGAAIDFNVGGRTHIIPKVMSI